MIFEVAESVFRCGNLIRFLRKWGICVKIYIIIDKRAVIWYNYIL